jgi:hypothetical protein
MSVIILIGVKIVVTNVKFYLFMSKIVLKHIIIQTIRVCNNIFEWKSIKMLLNPYLDQNHLYNELKTKFKAIWNWKQE